MAHQHQGVQSVSPEALFGDIGHGRIRGYIFSGTFRAFDSVQNGLLVSICCPGRCECFCLTPDVDFADLFPSSDLPPGGLYSVFVSILLLAYYLEPGNRIFSDNVSYLIWHNLHLTFR